jgi:hypothetical protein
LLVTLDTSSAWSLTFCAIARDFFDPTPEQQNVVLIDAATLQRAQRMIAACEACSKDAENPIDNILDQPDGF